MPHGVAREVDRLLRCTLYRRRCRCCSTWIPSASATCGARRARRTFWSAPRCAARLRACRRSCSTQAYRWRRSFRACARWRCGCRSMRTQRRRSSTRRARRRPS
eukprot:89012-Chlamydomonas_euryale.AAC.2